MVFRNLHQFRYLFNFDYSNWTLREKCPSIYCFMLVPGMANHTPRNWPHWHSTDWYWEDISVLNAWIHSFGFTTNVRTIHTSTLLICGYFFFWNDGYLIKKIIDLLENIPDLKHRFHYVTITGCSCVLKVLRTLF